MMIYTARCAVMIYQACGLDKKIRQVETCRIFWLGHRDSNPGNDGVRVRCLTAWRCPNIYFTTRIIADFFLLVNRYLQKKIKLFSYFFNFREFSLYFFFSVWYNNKALYFCPWHSWIARQTPTLKASGSNPLGQAKKRQISTEICRFLFKPQAWYGIAVGVWHHQRCIFLRLDSIRLLCNQFHTATSCGFHARLRRD